jgi:copper chaperone
MKNVVVTVNGMNCGGCVARLSRALQAVSGIIVQKVTIGSAELSIDESKVTTDHITNAVIQARLQVVSIE